MSCEDQVLTVQKVIEHLVSMSSVCVRERRSSDRRCIHSSIIISALCLGS